MPLKLDLHSMHSTVRASQTVGLDPQVGPGTLPRGSR